MKSPTEKNHKQENCKQPEITHLKGLGLKCCVTQKINEDTSI